MNDDLIHLPSFLTNAKTITLFQEKNVRCGCQNCMLTCEVYCEENCEICESCQGVVCETGCQESCQVSCMCSNQGGQCFSEQTATCKHDWVEYHGTFDCKDEKGHEWYKKCKKCKLELGMKQYVPGVLFWSFEPYNKQQCKQYGDCEKCGKRYYKYPEHVMVDGICQRCGFMDQRFSWNPPIISGQNINLTADEWNRFQRFINSKRKSIGMNEWSFTRVLSGRRMLASEYNDVRQSISGMGGKNLPPKMNTGDRMIANHLNMLVESVNNITSAP